MSDTLLIALVVGVVGPSIMALLTGWLAHKNKVEDWQRLDHIAAVGAAAAQKAEEAAAAAVVVVRETNLKLVQVAATGEKIHQLVNSDMTDARTAELEQAKATLVVLRKVVALDVSAGRESDPEDVEAIHTTQTRIAELAKIVAQRIATQKAIDDKAAAELTVSSTATTVEEIATLAVEAVANKLIDPGATKPES